MSRCTIRALNTTHVKEVLILSLFMTTHLSNLVILSWLRLVHKQICSINSIRTSNFLWGKQWLDVHVLLWTWIEERILILALDIHMPELLVQLLKVLAVVLLVHRLLMHAIKRKEVGFLWIEISLWSFSVLELRNSLDGFWQLLQLLGLVYRTSYRLWEILLKLWQLIRNLILIHLLVIEVLNLSMLIWWFAERSLDKRRALNTNILRLRLDALIHCLALAVLVD